MRLARFTKRIAKIEEIARAQWVRPDLSHLRWEALTAEEEALVLALNDRVGEVGAAGLTGEELEQVACLRGRLEGSCEGPCR